MLNHSNELSLNSIYTHFNPKLFLKKYKSTRHKYTRHNMYNLLKYDTIQIIQYIQLYFNSTYSLVHSSIIFVF